MSSSSQSLLRREGERQIRRPAGRRAPPDPRHGGSRTRDPARADARSGAPAGDRVPWHEISSGLVRYAPLAFLVTLSVTVVPAALAHLLVRAHGALETVAEVLCAGVLSLAIAAVEARVWRRVHGARGVVYSDLMLWGLARRLWAERRLKRIGVAYRAAVGEDAAVRVELLEGLSRLLEMRNPYTYGHCRRVARHAERIARAMHLGPAEIAEIRTAALIHDVGKVYTPPEILHKHGPLDDAEFAIVKRHAVDGADMLAPVRDRQLASVVRHHHERLDGSGYPDGLSGEEIPMGARILAVADTFDAITSHRPYRRARSQREGLAVLSAEAGRLLDADVVAAFERSHSTSRSVASVSLVGAVSARIAATLQLLPSGILGGTSIAGLLPAVGAAGVLAVAPGGARYERSARAGTPLATLALQPSLPGALEGAGAAPARGGAPAAGRRLAGGAPRRPRAGTRTPRSTGPVRRSEGVTVHGSTGAGGSSPGTPRPSGPSQEGPAVAVPVPPGAPPVTVPPVKVPPVDVPSVTTPSVTTPQVSVGAVTVPSTTVPSVKVQLPATPGVSVPGQRSPGS